MQLAEFNVRWQRLIEQSQISGSGPLLFASGLNRGIHLSEPGVADAPKLLFDHFGEHIGLALCVARDFVGPLHHTLVDIEAQKVAEDLSPCRTVAAQKAIELPLRQHDSACEAVEVESDDVFDAITHFAA